MLTSGHLCAPLVEAGTVMLSEVEVEVSPVGRPPTPPRVLGGRWELKSLLGSGTCGTTHLAEDLRLRRPAAVKIMEPTGEAAALSVRRFQSEALTLGQLSHPAIVQVYDAGSEDSGTHWIAMAYIPGRTLAEILRGTPRLPVRRATLLGAQMAAALSHAHARGFVHRDIKPGNVMVRDEDTRDESAVLLDFGIARILDRSNAADTGEATRLGAFFGTPAYMSPEQAQGRPVGPESDVYSLGVMLYRMLAGKLPGDPPEQWTPVSTLHYTMSEAPPLRRAAPDCPPQLQAIVDAMLIKDPAQRTLTAGAAAEALLGLQSTVSVQATALLTAATVSSLRPRWIPWAVAGVALAALAAVGAWFVRQGGDSPPSVPVVAPVEATRAVVPPTPIPVPTPIPTPVPPPPAPADVPPVDVEARPVEVKPVETAPTPRIKAPKTKAAPPKPGKAEEYPEF